VIRPEKKKLSDLKPPAREKKKALREKKRGKGNNNFALGLRERKKTRQSIGAFSSKGTRECARLRKHRGQERNLMDKKRGGPARSFANRRKEKKNPTVRKDQKGKWRE